METYRLNSKLVDEDKEYLIKTTNDVSLGTVESEVYINGALADTIVFPHPEQIKPEEVLSMVKSTHGEKKKEIETLLNAYRHMRAEGNPEMMYHLGLAFFYKRFYAEAKDLFEQALQMNPEYHEAFSYLAQVELVYGNVEAALKMAQSAVGFRAEYADYRNILGEAFMAARMYKKATLEFERAIGINLYYSDAYFNFGLALVMNALEREDTELFTNFLTKSQDYFTKAALIYPDYKTAVYEGGIEALKAQDLKRAFSLLKQVREDKKEQHRRKFSPYYMKYALHPQWATERAVQDRIRFLQNEISKNPTYVDLYAELARCYLEQGRILWKKGIDQYRKTLEINPALPRLSGYIDESEKVYESVNRLVKKIAEQG